MNHDCHNEIAELFEAGVINNYAKSYLENMCEEGLDDLLWEEAVEDMKLATSIGVSSKEDFELFFYIDHFAEDLIIEIFGIALSEVEEDSLKHYMFSQRNEIDFDNLISFRVAVLQWLRANHKLDKEANGLHSRQTSVGPYYLKRYNMEAWARLVTMVNKTIAFGINEKSALKEAASQIKDNIERLDFLAWFSFKFGKTKTLYDINKTIQQNKEGIPMKKATDKFAGIYEDALSYYVPKEVFKGKQEEQAAADLPLTQYDIAMAAEEEAKKQAKEEDLEFARAKLLSRTFAIDKLLQRHHNTLGLDQIGTIEDALNTLRKQIRKLTLASTMRDCIMRTANIVDQNGFAEGGTQLRKIATPIQKTASDNVDQGELNALIERLSDISGFLKLRAIVRDMAEADLQLYDMNLASMLPEITEAQAKLIDAFTYASNKIDDIIPKLRGASRDKDSQRHDDSPPLRVEKKEKEMEEKIPLTFPKDKELDTLPKEPKEPKKPKGPEMDFNRRKDDQPQDKKEKSAPAPDLDLEEILPAKKPKPAPKEKPKALLDLEKAIKE